MKTLHLILKKKWFDMIKSGEKKEEYRDISKHWTSRLANSNFFPMIIYKDFDTVTFTNGYAKDAPRFVIKFKGITQDFGNLNWGADKNKEYFVIKLGEIIQSKDQRGQG